MARPHRIDPPGAWHHVMNRGVDRMAIYRTQADAARFVDLLGDAVTATGNSVVSYALMPNHFHVLVRCDEGGLSTMMHALGSKYVRYFNDRHGRDGPLFRARFLSKLVHSWDYRVCVARYIHRNPLSLGRPGALSDFCWSSYGAYLGRTPAPTWLDPTPVLSVFGNDPVAYRSAVEDQTGPFSAPADTLLGLLGVISGELTHIEGPRRRSLERNVGVALLDHLEGHERERLLELLAFGSDDARNHAIDRARDTLATDVDATYLLDRLRDA